MQTSMFFKIHPLLLVGAHFLAPVSSQLENKNFRSLIRPRKCVRSSLSQSEQLYCSRDNEKKNKVKWIVGP